MSHGRSEEAETVKLKNALLNGAMANQTQRTLFLPRSPRCNLWAAAEDCCAVRHGDIGFVSMLRFNPRCHHVVFVTCTGSNHHQVNRVGAQRDVASGFGIINLTHHVIIISHCHLGKGLLKVIGQTVNSTTDDK